MKDSVDRIRNCGKSLILCELAHQVEEDETSIDSSSPNPGPTSDGAVTREAAVYHGDELMELSYSLEVITIVSHCCNERDLVGIDFSSASNLRELTVGDECCAHVQSVIVVGLNRLKRVKIGSQCCSEAAGGFLEVMECEKLRSVVIGAESFETMQVVAFVGRSGSSGL